VRRLALLAILVLLAGSAEARTFKGGGPYSLAVGYGAAWVGFGDGKVTRIDAESLRPVSRRLGSGVTGFAVTSLAAGFGSMWAASSSYPVHRLDPRTGVVRATVANQPGRWTGSGSLVATGAGFVWAVDYQRNAIFRVSPRTNRIGRRVVLRHRIRGIAAGPAGVWVQTVPGRGSVIGPDGPRIVSRLDPRTMRPHRALRLTCDASLQPVGRSVWVLDNCTGDLRRFDARTGELGARIETAPGAWGLTIGFGSLWVSTGSSVRRIDPARRAVIARVEVDGQFVAAGERFVWVLSSDGTTGRLRRIDPATTRTVGRPIRLSARQ
jgi:streptogramin lyase